MENDWTELAMRAKSYWKDSKKLRDRAYWLWRWIDDVSRYEIAKLAVEKESFELQLPPVDWRILFYLPPRATSRRS